MIKFILCEHHTTQHWETSNIHYTAEVFSNYKTLLNISLLGFLLLCLKGSEFNLYLCTTVTKPTITCVGQPDCCAFN